MTHPYQRSRFFRDTLPDAHVSEHGNIRSLHLGTPTIQSSMNIDNPAELVLSYSRAMMGWLLFANEMPQHALHIGLGGGSFVRWLHNKLPKMRQTAIEINPQVIHIARTSFMLPPENGQFEIIQADGAEYVKILRSSTDLILADGFDGVQIIEALTTSAFFADCRTALSPNGIFATNWWRGDKRYPQFVQKLKQEFAGRVLEIPAESHGNMAVLAFQAAPKTLQLDKLKKHAEQLSAQYHLDFRRLFADAKANNPHNGKTFYFQAATL
ncbi:MAG: polyamine aminopropyltransferase [Alysiella sp.]|uniref:polyamine aminopropyltransferase n=1 Tax=Alysiella sp. TaxID=1872483 RepID=UPI0026DB49EE|nr:polyamine aminopropyltransferase [Alysiella sp.]MDO4434262.1 polyamine aminopropyltransferase [Alysiella sp.]